MTDLPATVADRLAAWLDAYDRHAPGLVEGLYVVGSVALGDWQPASDIDVVAVLAEPADDDTGRALFAAHLADQEARPGDAVDGPFVAWGDLTVPPGPLHRPWVLDGTFHHDAEGFELNPAVWHTLATRGIAVRGPAAAAIGIHDDEADRIDWVRRNVADYWRVVHAELVGAVGELAVRGPDVDGATLPGEVVEWCVLGACRMLVTSATGEVTSKTDAGRRVAHELTDHAPAIELAVELRRTPRPVGHTAARAAAAAMGAILDEIPAP